MKTSPVHGLLYLLESWRREAHHGTQLGDFFRKRVPGPEALKPFQDLMEKSQWNTVRLPGDGGRGRRLSDVLEVMALQSGDEEDFLERAQSILDLEDWDRLRDAVRFAARYPVWEERIRTQADQLKARMDQGRFGERLRTAAHVYGSTWPVDRPFWVALVPIPLEPGQSRRGITTFGHSDGFLQVFEVLPDQDVAQSAGVVFHELCHALWNTSPVAEELQGKMTAYAYAQLNEGLATALGNGWFEGLLAGKLSDKPWYHDPIIAPYARALYPLLLPYLEDGRPLDAAFAQAADRAFAETFPDADRNVYTVLRSVLILTGLQDVHTGSFQNQLAQLGPLRSISVTELTDTARREKEPDSAAVYLATALPVPGWPNAHGPLTLRRTAHSWDILSVAPTAQGHLDNLRQLIKPGTLTETK